MPPDLALRIVEWLVRRASAFCSSWERLLQVGESGFSNHYETLQVRHFPGDPALAQMCPDWGSELME